MYFLYVLELQNKKHYVGVTQNIDRRFEEHKSGHGAAWTKTHPVIQVVMTMTVSDETCHMQETRKTLQLMWKHGVNNVRGAEFCENRDYTWERDGERLVRSLCHHMDLEYQHVRKTIRRELQLEPTCYNGRGYNNGRQCERCGRTSHTAKNCYATVDVKGHTIDDTDAEDSDEDSDEHSDEDSDDYERESLSDDSDE
jgi:predicted GIY-YIG superfamily endonuclease